MRVLATLLVGLLCTNCTLARQEQFSNSGLHLRKPSSTRSHESVFASHAGTMKYSSPIATTLAIRGGSVIPTVSKLSVTRMLNFLDLFGTGVFAFSGALTAGKKGMDLWGMIVVAVVTATGGGTVRDLLLDSGPVFWMVRPIYMQICILTTLATFLVWPWMEECLGVADSAVPICVADALGLGAFCVLATQHAMDHPLNLTPLFWVLVAVISCTFGGVTRDILCLQPPRVLYPHRTLYAGPVILGSTIYSVLAPSKLLTGEQKALLVFFLTTFGRILCFNRPWRMPHWKEPYQRGQRGRRQEHPLQQERQPQIAHQSTPVKPSFRRTPTNEGEEGAVVLET